MKAVSVIRNQLEIVLEQAVKVIDLLDTTTNNFDGMTVTPEVPSSWRALDEAGACPHSKTYSCK